MLRQNFTVHMTYLGATRAFGFRKNSTDHVSAVNSTISVPSITTLKQQVIAPGAARRCPNSPPPNGSTIRSRSMSFHERIHSPHMAKLQAASMAIAWGSCAMRQTDGRILTLYRTSCYSNSCIMLHHCIRLHHSRHETFPYCPTGT